MPTAFRSISFFPSSPPSSCACVTPSTTAAVSLVRNEFSCPLLFVPVASLRIAASSSVGGGGGSSSSVVGGSGSLCRQGLAGVSAVAVNRSDVEAGWSSPSACVRSSSIPKARYSVLSASHSFPFSASANGHRPLEAAVYAGVCVPHPSQEAPRLMAKMPSDTDEVPHLPEELDASLLPKHVAIIMDGNSRWAEKRGWPASMGHEAGVRSLKEVVKLAHVWGIKVLTVFAFSTENWLRPKMEVDFLMCLFEKVLQDELTLLAKENIRVHCMGDLSLLPESLRGMVARLDESTKHNTGLKFCIALSYSGRYDISSACQRLASRVEAGELRASDVTEAAIEEELKTSWVGEARDPDLLIRTSGEQRLSNFMLWQSAYSELHFVDSLWPDFGEVQFKDALLAYQKRGRRFGKRK